MSALSLIGATARLDGREVLSGVDLGVLPGEIVHRCDSRVRIPMAGTKRSLNVATAGGVVLYELFRKQRALPLTGRRP